MSTTTAPTVGTRFTRTDARPYTTQDGTKGVHTVTTLCEVTAMDRASLDYTVIEVLAETGRPEFANAHPERGSLAAFGWDRAVSTGRINVQGA